MKAITINGASTYLVFNATDFGVFRGFSFSIDESTTPVHEIDSIIPRELIPGQYKVTFKISGFLTTQDALKNIGVFSSAGNNLQKKYVTMALLDRKSNQLLYNFPAAIIDSVNGSVEAKGLFRVDVTGTSFVMKEGAEYFAPTGYSGTPPTLP